MLPTFYKELGLPMKCIKKCSGGDVGSIGFCYNIDNFNINNVNYWEPQHVYVISNDVVKINDIPYIPNGLLQSESIGQIITEENINTYISLNAQPIIASTDKKLTPNAILPYKFVQAYSIAYDNKRPINEIDLELIQNPNWFYKYQNEFIPKTRKDNTVIVHKSKTYTSTQLDNIINNANPLNKEIVNLERKIFKLERNLKAYESLCNQLTGYITYLYTKNDVKELLTQLETSIIQTRYQENEIFSLSKWIKENLK